MLIQYNRTFTYSCKHGNHVRRTRNNSKGHSFWRLPALLLCVQGLRYANIMIRKQLRSMESFILVSMHFSLSCELLHQIIHRIHNWLAKKYSNRIIIYISAIDHLLLTNDRFICCHKETHKSLVNIYVHFQRFYK